MSMWNSGSGSMAQLLGYSLMQNSVRVFGLYRMKGIYYCDVGECEKLPDISK